jgi:DNA ligase-1
MRQPWDIIKDLESDNSRLYKEDILNTEATAINDEFFNGVKLALDPMIMFGVKAVLTKTAGGSGLSWNGFKQLTDALSSRQLTGNAAIAAVTYARMTATEDQWNNWYRRILIKDLQCGVSEKTINKVLKNANLPQYAIPVFTCQLAFDSIQHEGKVAGKKLIECKLDGVRVITIVYPTGQVDQYSRNGKELTNFTVVKEQFEKHAKLFHEPMVLDGEIMSESFQDLMKQVRRKKDVETQDAVLHLFDILPLREFQNGKSTLTQTQRSANLLTWYNQIAEHIPCIEVVGQELVDLDTIDGQARYKEINTIAIEGGYEGIMVKDPDAIYECDRTVAWLKLKPFIEVSLKIVDSNEGEGEFIGTLGALVCEGTEDGTLIRVNVGGGFTIQQRAQLWATITQQPVTWVKKKGKKIITTIEQPTDVTIIGQVVEVRADSITQNQDGTYSLRFPRFLRYRGFEANEKL